MGNPIGYKKTYRLRHAIPGSKSVEVTFPYEVVDKEARKRGMSVSDFIARFQAAAQYNNFKGVIYTFEEIPPDERPKQVTLETGGQD